MTDYNRIKDILIMAEVLSLEAETTLEVITVDEITDCTSAVIFNFNVEGDLTGITTRQ